MKPAESTPREVLMAENAADVIADMSKKTDRIANELMNVYDRERKLLNGIRKREDTIESLRQKIDLLQVKVSEQDELLAKRKDEITRSGEQLDRLRGTKVMRMQRRYWKLRHTLRGDAKGGTRS